MSIETMLEKAKQIAAHAYAPYSNFRVGACIKTKAGALYTGCNIENASYGLSCCAETSAISQMVMQGEHHIAQIAVIGLDCDIYITPCGACRQRIREFADHNTIIYMANKHCDYESNTLAELLPKSFGPNFLENKHD